MWLRSPTPEATAEAGASLGRAVGPEGAVLGLEGALGAGKTCFVKGLAAGLGIDPDAVASPTFVIANEFPRPGGGVLAHVDLYRLTTEDELLATGFLDWLVPGNVVAVEWSDRLPDALPSDRLHVRFEKVAGDGQRRLFAIASGPGAQALLARWREEASRAASAHGLQVEPEDPAS